MNWNILKRTIEVNRRPSNAMQLYPVKRAHISTYWKQYTIFFSKVVMIALSIRRLSFHFLFILCFFSVKLLLRRCLSASVAISFHSHNVRTKTSKNDKCNGMKTKNTSYGRGQWCLFSHFITIIAMLLDARGYAL